MNQVKLLIQFHQRFRGSKKKVTAKIKVAEKMITLGKKGDLHARRQALSYVRDREVVGKLFDELSSRYRDCAGGYTRIVKMGNRTGDNAPVSIIEFIRDIGPDQTKKKVLAQK